MIPVPRLPPALWAALAAALIGGAWIMVEIADARREGREAAERAAIEAGAAARREHRRIRDAAERDLDRIGDDPDGDDRERLCADDPHCRPD